MPDKLYSRNEIVDEAIRTWDVKSLNRAAVLKQVGRTLTEYGIEPQEVEKDGKTKLYLIGSLSSFVRDKMFDYFKKNFEIDITRMYAAQNITDEQVNEHQGTAEDARRAVDEFFLKGSEANQEMESDEEREHRIFNEQVELEFNRRKYQIMIETAFNENFELLEEQLKEDVKRREEFMTYGDDEDATKTDLSLLERYKHNDAYYRRRTKD